VLLDPGSNLGQILVLLANVVLLAEVDEVDDRLGRKEEERVDDLDLANGKLVFADLCGVSRGRVGVSSQKMDVTSESPGVTRTSESWDYRAIALCHLSREREWC
jgi:hypothetical protein